MPILVAVTLILVLLMMFSGGGRSSPPPPERCGRCGARITLMYQGGKLCETCTKKQEAMQEALERIKYLDSQRR